MQAIDIHNHFFPETWPDLEARFGGHGPWPAITHQGGGRAMVTLGGKPFREIDARCWDPALRLADMDRDAIARQVISATPVLFAYQSAPAHAADIARLMNDAALELTAQGKGRLAAMAQVPLQDADLACREVERVMADGHVGVQIGNHVGVRDLDDDALVTFLSHCAALDCPVLVHPWDMLGGERTKRFMMAWTVAMPAETQLSIVAMILGGAFDRLPRNLRICFAHGGGSFAFLLGRLDNAWAFKDTVRGRSTMPPSRYVDRFFVDSAVFDPRALRLLVDVLGAGRVLLGSDYPFPLGEQRVGALVRETPVLTETERRQLLAENARTFLGARFNPA